MKKERERRGGRKRKEMRKRGRQRKGKKESSLSFLSASRSPFNSGSFFSAVTKRRVSRETV